MWSALTSMTKDQSLEPGWTYHSFEFQVLNSTNQQINTTMYINFGGVNYMNNNDGYILSLTF